MVPQQKTSQQKKISDAQAQAMAENALQAYNSGDYAAWSRDWSETMIAAINEGAFLEFRDQTMQALGNYVSIEKVERKLGNSLGVVRFEFLANFEKGQQMFMLAFLEDEEKIEGVTLTSVQ